jgi:hypothetical protein
MARQQALIPIAESSMFVLRRFSAMQLAVSRPVCPLRQPADGCDRRPAQIY